MRMSVGTALLLAAISTLGCALHGDGEGKNMREPGSREARIFELRTYTASPGKLDALNARFREHTNALFGKHAMTVIGYFTPVEGARQKDTLIYIPRVEAGESGIGTERPAHDEDRVGDPRAHGLLAAPLMPLASR